MNPKKSELLFIGLSKIIGVKIRSRSVLQSEDMDCYKKLESEVVGEYKVGKIVSAITEDCL